MAVLTEVPRAEFLCERHGGDSNGDRKGYEVREEARWRQSNGWWMKGVDRIQSRVGSVASEVVGAAGGLTETRLTVARIENGPACQIRPIPSPPGQNPPTQLTLEYLKRHTNSPNPVASSQKSSVSASEYGSSASTQPQYLQV